MEPIKAINYRQTPPISALCSPMETMHGIIGRTTLAVDYSGPQDPLTCSGKLEKTATQQLSSLRTFRWLQNWDIYLPGSSLTGL